MKVAFCTWKFPALANTFILNEIVEVHKRGHEVSIYSIDPPDEDVVHPDVERYGLLSRTSFLGDFVPDGARPEKRFAKYADDWLLERVLAFRPIARKLTRAMVKYARQNQDAYVKNARIAGDIAWVLEGEGAYRAPKAPAGARKNNKRQ